MAESKGTLQENSFCTSEDSKLLWTVKHGKKQGSQMERDDPRKIGKIQPRNNLTWTSLLLRGSVKEEARMDRIELPCKTYHLGRCH